MCRTRKNDENGLLGLEKQTLGGVDMVAEMLGSADLPL